MNDLKIFDYETALSRIGNDTEIFVSIIQDFLKVDKDTVSKIESLVKEKEFSLAQKEAHRLKGCLLTIGGDELAFYCKEIEQSIKLETATLESLNSLLPKLQESQKKLLAQISEFMTASQE